MDSGHPEGECCKLPHCVFVFGSNLAGVHGAGAALHAAQHHGAVRGIGVGLMPPIGAYQRHSPNRASYAIPTKDQNIRPLPLHIIEYYILQFLEVARLMPSMQFFVTKVGCGLAGYQEHQIAPRFEHAPQNCILPHGWRTTE